jgi:hypothetical protein
MRSLTLYDYADRELAGVIRDVAGPDGWAWTPDISKQLGIDNKRRNQCVGIRLGWLKKYGVVEYHEKGGRWRLSAIGEVFLNGDLDAQQEELLDEVEPEQMLMVTRWMTRRWRKASKTEAHLVRREWMRGTTVRR